MAGGWLAALAGYLFTYYNSKLETERDARLERVNEQLREFYGPLLACVTATASAYAAMVKQHSPDGTRKGLSQAIQSNPEGPEACAYRLWMTEVLQPLNEKAAAIVTNRIDLLESSRMEQHLLRLVAHVYAYRVVIERWKEGDYRQYSVLKYPDQLADYVQQAFAALKERQARLLGLDSVSIRAKL